MLNPRQWSERTVIALVMQHLDNSITTFTKRGKLGIRWYSSKQGHGEPNPTWIPIGNQVTRRIAAKIDGVAGGTWGELFNIPLTAHFLGGAVIGDDPEHGVIDPYHRSMAIRRCTWLTVRRSRRTWVSTRRCPSPLKPSGPPRCGRTRAKPTGGHRRVSPIVAGADPTGAPGGACRRPGRAAVVADRSGQQRGLRHQEACGRWIWSPDCAG